MSPEIYIDKKLIANVPDKTGDYKTRDGSPLHVNVDGIDPSGWLQNIVLKSPILKGVPGRNTGAGERTIQLSLKGKGAQQLNKSGELLTVKLHNAPIRRSYTEERVTGASYPSNYSYKGAKEVSKIVWKNPYWTQGNGRR